MIVTSTENVALQMSCREFVGMMRIGGGWWRPNRPLAALDGSRDDDICGTSEMVWRITMSDSETLIEQLQRSNLRWKALALAACSALVLASLVGFVAMSREQRRAEFQVRAAL